MTFEHELQTLIRTDADRLHPVGRGPGAARRRAEQRRRRTLAAGLAAVAVAAVVAVPVMASRDDGRAIDVATDPDPDLDAPVESSEPVVTPLEFTWTEMDAPLAYVEGGALTTADGVLYALSTAPGVEWPDEETVEPLPQAVYRSTDGVTWEAALPDPSLGRLSSLTERDGLLYAITTAPAAGDALTMSVLTSADGGSTWTPSDLPADTTPPDAAVPIEATSTVTRLGTTPEGAMVALVSTNFRPDLSPLLTAAEEDLSWNITDAGFEIVDLGWTEEGPPPTTAAPAVVVTAPPQEPVVQTITWDELGLSGRGDLQRRQMFHSTDGVTWEQVDNPLPDQVGGFETTPQGILAWTWPTGEAARIFRTTDGLDWTEIAPPGSGSGSVGVTGDRLVVVEGLRVHTSTDAGATWSSTDLGSLVGSESFGGSAQVGPLGTAIVAFAGDPEGSAPADTLVLFSPDGVNWSVTVPGIPPGAGAEVLAVSENSIVVTSWVTVDDGVESRAFVGVPNR